MAQRGVRICNSNWSFRSIGYTDDEWLIDSRMRILVLQLKWNLAEWKSTEVDYKEPNNDTQSEIPNT